MACLRWGQINTGGLALGFTALSVFYSVSLHDLMPLAFSCLVLLAGFGCITVRPIRTLLEQEISNWWEKRGIATGEAFVPLLAVWLWDRLLLPATLPTIVYLLLGTASFTAAWVSNRLQTRWRCVFPAIAVTLPLIVALYGTPDAPTGERLIFLGLFTATAAIAHRFVVPFFGADVKEVGRLWLLGLASLWLAEPLLTAQSNGAGDAQWYTLVMADAIAQWRAGFFPPIIGRSEFAFSGSSFPGNFAPYYQCLGVLLNLATGDILNAFAIKNLTATLSLVGGAAAAYRALTLLSPGYRNRAAALALLYVASPAWLGALYSMDMYMTVMTLPWLPLLLAGCVHSFVLLNLRTSLWIAATLALTWLAHPPVALWATIAVVISQLVRISTRRSVWHRELLWSVGTLVSFAALTCLPFATAFLKPRHRRLSP